MSGMMSGGNTEEFKWCYVHTDNGTDCGIFTDEKGLGRSSTNQEASIIWRWAKQTTVPRIID
jgi:hypothetical protein